MFDDNSPGAVLRVGSGGVIGSDPAKKKCCCRRGSFDHQFGNDARRNWQLPASATFSFGSLLSSPSSRPPLWTTDSANSSIERC